MRLREQSCVTQSNNTLRTCALSAVLALVLVAAQVPFSQVPFAYGTQGEKDPSVAQGASADAEQQATDGQQTNEQPEVLESNNSELQPSTIEVAFDLSDVSSDFTPVVEISGVAYDMSVSGSVGTIELPATEQDIVQAAFATAYSYNKTSSDTHEVYPTEMFVWFVSYDANTQSYSTERLSQLDNALKYAGCSIRAFGEKGMRLVTSVPISTKDALTSEGLYGFTLEQYGTVIQWDYKLDGAVLTRENTTLTGTAYNRATGADPIYKNTGSVIKYTNVLVGFNYEQCKNDMSMRPYMELTDASGNTYTLYGGTVHRSVGYVASQNPHSFGKGTVGYRFIWDIIHAVYGDTLDDSLGYEDWDIRDHVPWVCQGTTIPWGCESVALGMSLCALGYDVGLTEIYDYYLSHSTWDFVHAFCGDAYAMVGLGCTMPPAITDAANRYLSAHGATEHAVNIAGSSFDTLLDYIDLGYPVIVWHTTEMLQPQLFGIWQEGYQAYGNLHCVVIYGYDDDYIFVSDSITGTHILRDRATFESIYYKCGKNAVVIV